MNDGKKDTERIYVWLARDPDGTEGVIAWPTEMGFMPLMFTDEDVAASYREPARAAALARRSKTQLVVFTRGEVLDEVDDLSGPYQ
jgi:hypothetical protein